MITKNIEISKKTYKNNIDREDNISTQILQKLIDYCEKNEKKAALTLNNAYMVETLLKIDSNYKNARRKDKKPCIKFMNYITNKNINIDVKPTTTINSYGSSAYWIDCYIRTLKGEKITEVITGKINRQTKTEKYLIDSDIALKGVICAIDRENSTHLTADYVGRNNVYTRIKEYVESDVKRLKKGLENYDLINIIAEPKQETTRKNEHNNQSEIKERYHFSFATKFCRYVCLRINEHNVEADTFYIWDNILKKNLDFYAKEYEVEKFKLKKFDNAHNSPKEQYIRYNIFLDEIRKKAREKYQDSEQISRNALDHIIWYFNK